MICSKFITFAVTKTTFMRYFFNSSSCDLLKIHYLCGNKDNITLITSCSLLVVICSKFITFAVTKTTYRQTQQQKRGCDLLKIHYLCGNKDNNITTANTTKIVVICSKFITFAVTKTTLHKLLQHRRLLWFAQNSLPLR